MNIGNIYTPEYENYRDEEYYRMVRKEEYLKLLKKWEV